MSKPTERMRGCLLCLACFALICYSAFILFLDWETANGMMRQCKTSKYIETIGTVTQSNMEITPNGKGTRPMFQYEYIVNDTRYIGTKYKFLVHDSIKVSRQLVADFPVDSTLPVYYCPDQPQLAVLCKGLDRHTFIFPLLWIPFNGIMLLGFYALLKIKLRRFVRNKERWFRDFPIQSDGTILRLRISTIDPVATTLYGILPSLLVLLILSDIGYNDLALVFGGGTILLGGLLGYCYAYRSNCSGLYELMIDKTHGVLLLPWQPEWTLGPTVPFDAIEEITLVQTDAVPSFTLLRKWDTHILMLRYHSEDTTKSAIIASKHNLGTTFHFTDADPETELTELKHWILREIGR
jgi:hypothetical protein